MARLPEPLPEQDRLQMIRWKQQGLSYDDITSHFAGKYTRGKIVGEINRAENAGEFQPTRNINNANNDQSTLTGTPTFVPVFHPVTQRLPQSQPPQTQTPRFLIVNRYPPPRAVPQSFLYQPPSDPTIIFTQPPEKPFDIFEYMFRKTIDGYSERLAQAPAQTPLIEDQIQRVLARQKEQEHEEKRRELEENLRRESEEKELAEKERIRAELERELALQERIREEHRNSLRQMEETGWIEKRRKEQENFEELRKLIHEQTTDDQNRTMGMISESHKDAMKVVDMKTVRAAKHEESVQEEIGFLRDVGNIARKATYPPPKTPQSLSHQVPGLRIYQLIHSEVHEERQRRVEHERRQRNIGFAVGIVAAGLYLGKEILKTYAANGTRNQ